MKRKSNSNNRTLHRHLLALCLFCLSFPAFSQDNYDWDNFKTWTPSTEYKKEMFTKTNTEIAPWIVIKANRKSRARIE